MVVRNDDVEVVAEHAEVVDSDSEALGGVGEAEEEDLVDLRARPKKELTLCAASSEEKDGAWRDLPGGGHSCVRRKRDDRW